MANLPPTPSAKVLFIYSDLKDGEEPNIGDEDKLADNQKRSRIQTLIGHGKAIHALATSPTHPYILASCSDDNNIFLWSLAEAHQKAPCIAVIGGWDISIGFCVLTGIVPADDCYLVDSTTGSLYGFVPKYPDPDHLPLAEVGEGGWTAKVVDVPYFVSSEVHGQPVERVQFFNDIIISHGATEEYVQLWQILGFSSNTPKKQLPTKATFLDEEARTHSAWQFTDRKQPLYERLIRFRLPIVVEELRYDPLIRDIWHLKRQSVDFDLYTPRHDQGEGGGYKHAILAVSKGNEIRFWDFERFLVWQEKAAHVAAGGEVGPAMEGRPGRCA